jgi:hypothetical protein
MFHVIARRVQQQMLGTSFHELSQAVDALIRTPAYGHSRGHISPAIPNTEPAAQAFLGTGLIGIDRDIDALGDRKGRRVTLGVVEKTADTGGLGLKVRVRG